MHLWRHALPLLAVFVVLYAGRVCVSELRISAQSAALQHCPQMLARSSYSARA